MKGHTTNNSASVNSSGKFLLTVQISNGRGGTYKITCARTYRGERAYFRDNNMD